MIEIKSSVLGTEGRWFESSRPDQEKQRLAGNFLVSLFAFRILSTCQQYARNAECLGRGCPLSPRDQSLRPIEEQQGTSAGRGRPRVAASRQRTRCGGGSWGSRMLKKPLNWKTGCGHAGSHPAGGGQGAGEVALPGWMKRDLICYFSGFSTFLSRTMTAPMSRRTKMMNDMNPKPPDFSSACAAWA